MIEETDHLAAARKAVLTTNEPPSSNASGTSIQPAEPERFGAIAGSVLDRNGKPLARHYVAFRVPREADYFAPQFRTRADADGYYEIARVPIGSWKACYVGIGEGDDDYLLENGEVEVREDRVTAFDFAIVGERKLAGAFPTAQQDLEQHAGLATTGMSLELELRTRWPPSRVVARAAARTLRRDPDAPPYDPAKDDVPASAPRGVGRFEMHGLEPEVYVLRIRLPATAKHPTTGAALELYIERDVDLTRGDVTLEPEELSFVTFLQAAFARQ